MTTAVLLAALSDWIDTSPANAVRDREAAAWGRISKVSEECGEVIEAFIGVTGQNPRKGIHGCIDDVVEELLDVAVTALAAVEHFNDNDGSSLDLFAAKVQHVANRAGVSAPRPRPG